MNTPCVQITFDCLPLRSVGRLDVPLDASPKFRQLCDRIRQAIDKHGSHNSYYLHNAACIFHLTNQPQVGMLEFHFEGTLLTDPEDLGTQSCDLDVRLARETCDWLVDPVVEWFAQSVSRAVRIEFDRYIQAGDLEWAKQRMQEVRDKCDESGGYLGMYL